MFFHRRHKCDPEEHEKIFNIVNPIIEMAVKTTMRYYLTLARMAVIKKITNNKCWRGWGEKGHKNTVSGNINWCNHCGNSMRCLKNLQVRLLYHPAIILLGVYLKKRKENKNIHLSVCSSIIYSIQDDMEANEVFIKTWMNEEMFIHKHTHILDCYSTMKKIEISPFATTWMGLELL